MQIIKHSSSFGLPRQACTSYVAIHHIARLPPSPSLELLSSSSTITAF